MDRLGHGISLVDTCASGQTASRARGTFAPVEAGDVLTISGRRQEEERDKNHSEFRYGSFSRSVRLPPGIDRTSIAATYDNGVLEVRVPVGEARSEVTKVPVQRAGS